MSAVTYIFPAAAVVFILLVFSRFLPLLKEPELVSLPRRPGKRDALLIAGLCLCYGASAFTGLGVNSAPQSFCRFEEKGQYALIELDEPREISAIMYYSGLFSGEYRLQLSADGESWADQEPMTQSHADLFKWQYAGLSGGSGPVRFIRITAGSRLWLGELAIYGENGELISGVSCQGGAAKLFDEQELIPEAPDYLNSAYFDEIYHARTAYENVENIYPYEISHPPLGKLIISIGVRLFGMTPFGWRFMGTLFGVLMLPFMYLFLKKLFGGTAVPYCVTALFAFDFMHFVQTRIATIDTYGVFFTILMYFFMYGYLRSDRSRTGSWLPPLALSGLCFGLGAACKWTCIYAGGGLAVIWLIDRFERGIFTRETGKNILCCLVFFVCLPALIYYMSYYPYGRASGMEGPGMYFRREYLDLVLENQKFMLTYHSGVTASHPYSSRWYQWIVDARPILYYLNYFDNGDRSSFGAFVSPLLCWGGLLAILSMAWLWISRGDRTARFIFLGWLAQLLPWVFIGRVTFEYHYFPCTVFLSLALGYVFNTIRRRSLHWRVPLLSFTTVGLVLFAVFYPVLSGARVPGWYCSGFLGWLPSWPF